MILLIKNAHIIDYNKDFNGDILLVDGIISDFGNLDEKNYDNYNIYDVNGLTIMPAFIDLHSHFRDPGDNKNEDIESGSWAAIKGGFTTVNLMANTNPVCDNMKVVDYILEKSKKNKIIDIFQTVSCTRNMEGKDISHLDDICNEKIKFISDDGKGIEDDIIMEQVMIKAKEKGLTIISHAEFAHIDDKRISENKMTKRDIDLAQKTGANLHIAHVSTKEAINYIIEAKKKKINITCEVTPHHISLFNNNYKVNPPLRNKEDVLALIDAIRNNYIDIISTDHAPHTYQDKLNGSPGISGLETAFSVCYTYLVKKGYITLNKLSELMSKKPAELLNINKGQIEKGFQGDLVIFDLKDNYIVNSKSFHSKGKNTPFDGDKLFGVRKKVIKNID